MSDQMDPTSIPELELLRGEFERAAARRRPAVAGRTAAIGAAVVLALVAASFTPPGRAATGWIARAAGFDDEPTLPQVSSVPGTAVVVDSGKLSDGTPFEVVAKRVNLSSVLPRSLHQDLDERGLDEPVVCFQANWTSIQRQSAGGMCSRGAHPGRGGNPPLESNGLFAPPGAQPGSPALYMGLVDDQEVAKVRVTKTSPSGEVSDLPLAFVTIKGALARRIGVGEGVRVYVVNISESDVQAASSGQQTIEARAYGTDGQSLGRPANPFLGCLKPAPILCPK
jgi:hypothetical protein